ALTDRYILYGEWLYAKHTVFYTDLPHYFLEFDIDPGDGDPRHLLHSSLKNSFVQTFRFVRLSGSIWGKMLKQAFKFRLYPTSAQETILRGTLETCRDVYNSLLHERKH